MVHRGSTREAKRVRPLRMSTPLDKYRRHRNKARIWRRAVKRLAIGARTIDPFAFAEA